MTPLVVAVLLSLSCPAPFPPTVGLYGDPGLVAAVTRCGDAALDGVTTCPCPVMFGRHRVLACGVDLYQTDTTTTIACSVRWNDFGGEATTVTRRKK